ncbi:MAG: hypothetical protein ACI4MJ_07680 [Aristaeellaceae bacterium]
MKRTCSFLLVLMLTVCCMSNAFAASLSVTARTMDNGDVYVKWTDTGGPYKVTYDLVESDCYYTAESSTYGTTTLLEYLAPGSTYNIKVTDLSDNTTGSTKFEVPVEIFREFKTGNMYLKLTKDSFSISQTKSNPLDTFDLRVYWPKLKYDREYKGKLVLETPLGNCSSVRVWQSYTLENRYSYSYNTYSMYTDFLSRVEDDYGTIPAGKYTFKMYFDGKLYDYVSFTLRK